MAPAALYAAVSFSHRRGGTCGTLASVLSEFWQDEVAGQLADWLSAIGTTGAVIVALWLARREHSMRLKISAGIRLLITPGDSREKPPEFLVIRVVNVGIRTATISAIGWRAGVLRKRYAMQLVGTSNELLAEGVTNPPLPLTLAEGQTGNWCVRIGGSGDWLLRFARDFCNGPAFAISSHFLVTQVSTTMGRTFKAPVEPELRRRLVEAAKAARRLN